MPLQYHLRLAIKKQLNLFILLCSLGLSFPSYADFVVGGTCTIIQPIMIPGVGTVCTGGAQDLDGVDLSGIDLQYADFSGATLTNVNFDNSDLSDAKFSGADWSGASFASVIWSNTVCADGTNSNQYLGNGCFGTFSDDDGDGVSNANDDFPSSGAASLDSDSDGYPDFWTPNCDLGCQSGSGLTLDKFPDNIAASKDDDEDGFPEQWNAGCDTGCQGASGLALDAGQLYVDKNKLWAGSNGLSWATAFPNVADALAVATAGKEIWIAKGVYYPDEYGGGNFDAAGATFALVNNVNLLGGFSGSGTETMASQANPSQYEVVLNGDITQDDTNVVDGIHTAFQSGTTHNGTNSHVIVTANSVTSRLTNLIISGGGSNVSGNEYGGGIKCSQSNLRLERVKLVYNRAITSGGAIYCSNDGGEKLEIIESLIDGNYAGTTGGGIFAQDGFVDIRKSAIINNSANYGGGILQNGSKSKIVNSTIAYNSASQGGGIHITGTGSITAPEDLILTMSTLALNDANSTHGGGLYINNFVEVKLKGSVVIGNTALTASAGNVYRTTNDIFRAGYTSFGNTSDGKLFLNGTGSVGLATFLSGGVEPTVKIPTVAGGTLINNTLMYLGGTTPVLSIPPGSEYRNAIPVFNCDKEVDQRGVERPYQYDTASQDCDMGAYEFDDHDLDGNPDILDPDDDNDGMPDDFELSYGLNPHFITDAGSDNDGDTLTNLQEFNLGRNPTIPDISEAETELLISPRYHRYGYESATCQTSATPVTYTIKNKDPINSRDILSTISFIGDLDWQLRSGYDFCSNQTIAANSSCTFQVVYCGSGVGNSSGMITISTDDTETPILTSALFDYESDKDEAQRRLPPVLSDLVIRNSSSTIITDGQIKGGEVHSYEWTITGYHPSYDSLVAAFNCDSITYPNCGDLFSGNFFNSGFLTPGTFGAGTWTYNGIVADTYTYTTSFSLPYNVAESNEWVLRFYQKSLQDSILSNPSISLLIPGNIMPASGYYDTSGRRIKVQVVP